MIKKIWHSTCGCFLTLAPKIQMPIANSDPNEWELEGVGVPQKLWTFTRAEEAELQGPAYPVSLWELYPFFLKIFILR